MRKRWALQLQGGGEEYCCCAERRAV